MILSNKRPVAGRIYTFNEMYQLDLPDSPYLQVRINGRLHSIQDAHVTVEQTLKNCPRLERSTWQYVRTTHEDIPVFTYVGSENLIRELFDYEPYKGSNKGGLWITPKGSPREQ